MASSARAMRVRLWHAISGEISIVSTESVGPSTASARGIKPMACVRSPAVARPSAICASASAWPVRSPGTMIGAASSAASARCKVATGSSTRAISTSARAFHPRSP